MLSSSGRWAWACRVIHGVVIIMMLFQSTPTTCRAALLEMRGWRAEVNAVRMLAQEFFFPKEDENVKRQEAWVQAMEPVRPGKGHTRKGSNLSVLSDNDSLAATSASNLSLSLSRPGSPEASGSRSAAAAGGGTGPLIATSSSSGM